MDKKTVEILKVRLNNLKMVDILEKVEKGLQCDNATMRQCDNAERKPLVIFTPNQEIIMQCQENEELLRIVNSSQINICDGQGVLWASQILGQPIKEKVSGIDLLEKLVEMAYKKGLEIGLIGGQVGIALQALECLKKKYPGLKGWAEEGPVVPKATPLPQIPIEIGRWVSARGGLMKPCSFLFVGLGCPKQEYFIEKLQGYILRAKREVPTVVLGFRPRTINPLVLMSVGGAFDILSGRLARAALILRKIGLEWLWRLMLEPWRLKRQLALVKFSWLVVKQRLVT